MHFEDISRMMRNQAWERAKGELKSILWTFHGKKDSFSGQFDKFEALLEDFVNKIEENGLHE